MIPDHPLVSDAAARALLQALMNAELLGIALLRGPSHVHAMVNAKYESLMGCSVLGRSIDDVLPRERSPAGLLRRVRDGHGPIVQRHITLRDADRYITFTYHAVNELDGESILVLAEDATEVVLERRRADLFVDLVARLLPSIDPRAVVRSVVTQVQHELGATSSSIFILRGDQLHGAIGDWDWTRTSFTVPLREWPSIQAALESRSALHLTRDAARGAETGWFERRGIASTLCVPLCANDVCVGVLFFDFEVVKRPSRASITFVENVAPHCAASLAREMTQSRP